MPLAIALSINRDNVYYRSDDILFCEWESEVKIPAGWSSTELSTGYSHPGKWPVGMYTVVVSINAQEVYKGHFWIRA